jgi:branched-chain amino acid transport system ATP-binding protein
MLRAPQNPVLAAQALQLRFGAVEALKDVSIAIAPGEIHAIIGPNGAGKSSLLNCLSGFYRPQSGAVMFESREITELKPHRRAALGMGRTFQGIQTYPSMTVRENILTGFHNLMRTGLFDALIYWGRTRAEEERFAGKAEEIIEFLELEELRHTPVGDLSYGLRKRVDLGRALAMEPRVLLMDEPMAGMNLEEKEDMARFIIDIREAMDIPILIVEHDMQVVMDIADRIVVLDWGHVIAEGQPAAIKRNAAVIKAYLGEEHA